MIGRHGSYPKLKSKYLIVPRVRNRKVYSFVTCLCSAVLHLVSFVAGLLSFVIIAPANPSKCSLQLSCKIDQEFIALLNLFTVPFFKDFCDQKCLILEASVLKI